MEAFVGVVKKEHGVKFLKKFHQKKLREIQRQITKEERQTYIEDIEKKTIEVSGCKKMDTCDILRILSEKECPICGKTVYPPRIYCQECRPQKAKSEENESVSVATTSLETFEFTPCDKHGFREQL